MKYITYCNFVNIMKFELQILRRILSNILLIYIRPTRLWNLYTTKILEYYRHRFYIKICIALNVH